MSVDSLVSLLRRSMVFDLPEPLHHIASTRHFHELIVTLVARDGNARKTRVFGGTGVTQRDKPIRPMYFTTGEHPTEIVSYKGLAETAPATNALFQRLISIGVKLQAARELLRDAHTFMKLPKLDQIQSTIEFITYLLPDGRQPEMVEETLVADTGTHTMIFAPWMQSYGMYLSLLSASCSMALKVIGGLDTCFRPHLSPRTESQRRHELMMMGYLAEELNAWISGIAYCAVMSMRGVIQWYHIVAPHVPPIEEFLTVYLPLLKTTPHDRIRASVDASFSLGNHPDGMAMCDAVVHKLELYASQQQHRGVWIRLSNTSNSYFASVDDGENTYFIGCEDDIHGFDEIHDQHALSTLVTGSSWVRLAFP